MYLLLNKCGVNVCVNIVYVTIVNESFIFTTVEMSHIQYLHTHLYHILKIVSTL